MGEGVIWSGRFLRGVPGRDDESEERSFAALWMTVPPYFLGKARRGSGGGVGRLERAVGAGFALSQRGGKAARILGGMRCRDSGARTHLFCRLECIAGLCFVGVGHGF